MKILLTYATAGAGHLKAAEAVYGRLKDSPEHDVTFADALDYTYPLYKKLYSGTYTFLVSNVPAVWAFAFYLINIPILVPLVRLFRRVYNWTNGRALEKYLTENNFDCIISSHFFPNEVSAALKRQGKITSKIITIITDYDAHTIWLAKGIDYYCVATDFTKERLISYGVTDQQAKVTGIPTEKKFSQDRNKKELRAKLGLDVDAFTVLVATGSFGIGPIEEIVAAVENIQMVVISGHNKDLFERLSGQPKALLTVCGLVDNMDEWMAASDCIVTKPGGMSTTESLVSGLPLIFFSAIPGQETNNVKVLKRFGVGVSDCSVQEIADLLHSYRDDPSLYAGAKEKARAIARPHAGEDIIKLIH